MKLKEVKKIIVYGSLNDKYYIYLFIKTDTGFVPQCHYAISNESQFKQDIEQLILDGYTDIRKELEAVK